MFTMNCMKLNQNMNHNDTIINHNELHVQFICKVTMLKKCYELYRLDFATI